MRDVLHTLREFRTAHFRVIVDAVPEDDLDLSWDDTGEVSERLESGEYVAFCARVRVIHNDIGEVSCDYLGGCIYPDYDAFQDHRRCGAATRKLRASGSTSVVGSYFSDMIHTACQEARKTIRAMQIPRVRAA